MRFEGVERRDSRDPSQCLPEAVRAEPTLDLIQSFNGSQASKVSTTNCRTTSASRSEVSANLLCALTAFCRRSSTRG